MVVEFNGIWLHNKLKKIQQKYFTKSAYKESNEIGFEIISFIPLW